MNQKDKNIPYDLADFKALLDKELQKVIDTPISKLKKIAKAKKGSDKIFEQAKKHIGLAISDCLKSHL